MQQPQQQPQQLNPHRRVRAQEELEDSDYWTSTFQVQFQGQGTWSLQELPEGQGAVVTLESGGQGLDEPRDPFYEGGHAETRYRREMIRFPVSGRRSPAQRSRSPPIRRASSPPRRNISPARQAPTLTPPRVIDLTIQGQTTPRREVLQPSVTPPAVHQSLAASPVVTTRQEVVIPVYPGVVAQRSLLQPLTRRGPDNFPRRAPEDYPSTAPDGYIRRAPEDYRGSYVNHYPVCAHCYLVDIKLKTALA
jgi:hypothetical protein